MRQPIAVLTAPSSFGTVRLIGAGALVAVGYMDPGKWATDIAGIVALNVYLLATAPLA